MLFTMCIGCLTACGKKDTSEEVIEKTGQVSEEANKSDTEDVKPQEATESIDIAGVTLDEITANVNMDEMSSFAEEYFINAKNLSQSTDEYRIENLGYVWQKWCDDASGFAHNRITYILGIDYLGANYYDADGNSLMTEEGAVNYDGSYTLSYYAVAATDIYKKDDGKYNIDFQLLSDYADPQNMIGHDSYNYYSAANPSGVPLDEVWNNYDNKEEFSSELMEALQGAVLLPIWDSSSNIGWYSNPDAMSSLVNGTAVNEFLVEQTPYYEYINSGLISEYEKRFEIDKSDAFVSDSNSGQFQ